MAYNIVWDEPEDRQYEVGCDHGVLYKKATSSSGAVTWEGEAWNGLINVNEQPSGAEANDIYADNIKYATLRSAEKYGITIEAYCSPAGFDACDGTINVSNSGVKLKQQKREKFGFAYRTDVGSAEDTDIDPDEDYILHLVWGLSAAPSEKQHSSVNESPEALQLSWECQSDPVLINGTVGGKSFKPISCMEIDSRQFKTTQKKALLDELLETLYGTTGTTTTKGILPDPEEVMEILGIEFDE